jgi:predicted methyltransferase
MADCVRPPRSAACVGAQWEKVMMNRRQFALATFAAAIAGSHSVAAGAAPENALAAIIAGPRRSEKNRVRDRYRHPGQSLAFWGLAPGMTVLEIDPSGGYWTEILAPYLGATHGRYIAAMGDEAAAFKARYADQAAWGAIEVVDFGPRSGPLAAPGSVDLLLTARNIHDWLWTARFFEKALADFHAALKPGGVLAVEEHRADPRPMVADARDGYVSTAFLTAAVEKAGFRLAASSEINANPRDTKNYPFGVWTLPPSLRNHTEDRPTPPGYDRAKYIAIGESDRMTLRFIKT